MIVTTAQLFKHAYGKYAVGAYNINNAEQAMGLFRGAIMSKAPFIIQISKGARSYTDKRMLEAIIRSAGEIFPEAIFAVHLDHGDEATCYDCIKSGFFSSVMIDASHDPFEKNIEITKRVVDAAHAKGISVEAELGMLGGVEEDIKVEDGHATLTNPAEAEEFVKRTGCDSLACAIGTSHGAFKFKGKQSLHFDVLEKIKALLPQFPLVMHGSSSVPQEEVARINAAGGSIRDSAGVDVNEYRWTPGLDARAPRVLPRQALGLRLPPPGQDLHGRVREVHRQPQPAPRLGRTARQPPRLPQGVACDPPG
jgi:fructose-bisphosphate aldolase class II